MSGKQGRNVEKTEENINQQIAAFMEKINLENIFLFDINSKKNKFKSVSFDELNKYLYENWVPTVNCDKCARSEYCKYPKEESEKLGLPVDKFYMKCGVVAGVIRNYINGFKDLLLKMEDDDLQRFFDGLWGVKDFVWDSESYIGTLADDYSVDWYKSVTGGDIKWLFTGIIKLRNKLDRAAEEFSKIKTIGFEQKMLFVEGWSEERFIKEIRNSKFMGGSAHNYPIKVYDGKSNIKTRIHELIKDYSKKGYEIYLQVDFDGKDSNGAVKQLIDKKLVKEKNVFAFKNDFEMSFPPRLMYETLICLQQIEGVSENDFCENFEKSNGSFNDLVKKYRITSSKVSISDKAAEILNESKKWMMDFVSNEDCELWRFIHFLNNIL